MKVSHAAHRTAASARIQARRSRYIRSLLILSATALALFFILIHLIFNTKPIVDSCDSTEFATPVSDALYIEYDDAAVFHYDGMNYVVMIDYWNYMTGVDACHDDSKE